MKSNSLPITMFGSNAFTMIQQLCALLVLTHQPSMQKCDAKFATQISQDSKATKNINKIMHNFDT